MMGTMDDSSIYSSLRSFVTCLKLLQAVMVLLIAYNLLQPEGFIHYSVVFVSLHSKIYQSAYVMKCKWILEPFSLCFCTSIILHPIKMFCEGIQVVILMLNTEYKLYINISPPFSILTLQTQTLHATH